jgi:hypothetical protein
VDYIIQAKQNGKFVGHFKAESVEDIASIASRLDGYELKIESVGHAIDTIYHPHKAVIIKSVLEQTLCQAPVDCPFQLRVYDWNRGRSDSITDAVRPTRDATETLIRWTFDHLIHSFKIDAISVETNEKTGSSRYTVTVK